jgi:hypothetical protein
MKTKFNDTSFSFVQERTEIWLIGCAVDPDVYGNPGPGSILILYESGSFHQQAKKIIKALISSFDFVDSF